MSWQRPPCQKILPFLKDYLEASIIQTAPFAAGFLKIVLDFARRQNASFRANILGMITNELLRNSLNA
jgi:hypothetical protein